MKTGWLHWQIGAGLGFGMFLLVESLDLSGTRAEEIQAGKHKYYLNHDNDLVLSQGFVGAGNYSTHAINADGKPIRVFLITLDGDADVYVSYDSSQPTFELSQHNLSSTTCGIDIVDVVDTDDRQVFVAVYGHPSSAASRYVLAVLAGERDEYETLFPTYDVYETIERFIEQVRVDDQNVDNRPEPFEGLKLIVDVMFTVLEVLFT